jgi:polysaccharide biosynthesis/export protein
MRLRRLFVVMLSLLTLAACARQVPRYAAAPQGTIASSELDVRMYGAPQPASYAVRRVAQVVPVAATFADGPYTLDSGDKLRIVVFGQDTLSNNYTVDAQGAVSLPLVGAVEARGLTTSQLGSAIAGRLRSGYVRDPSVAVEIETYRPFFVLGEVTFPGQYPYVPNMTVENAIAIAGGFTPRASKDKVTITRKVQGAPSRFVLPLRYPLRPGDTIEVAERWF